MDFSVNNRKRSSSSPLHGTTSTGTTPISTTNTSSWKRSRVEERESFTAEENEQNLHYQQSEEQPSAFKTPAVCSTKGTSNDFQQLEEDDSSSHNHEFNMEKLLSVPLEFLFRQVGASHNTKTTILKKTKKTKTKALLSRTEAHYLLRVSQLAYEIDILVHQIASKVLERQYLCHTLHQRIEQNANHPYLRPILTLLRTITGDGGGMPTTTGHTHANASNNIQYIQREMDRILYELASCAASLQQLAEQNWTLADSLLDAFGGMEEEDDDEDDEVGFSKRPKTTSTIVPGGPQELANEKRKLGDMQEEVATRIEWVLAEMTMFTTSTTRTTTTANEKDTSAGIVATATHQTKEERDSSSQSISPLSMKEFCYRLMGHPPQTNETAQQQDHCTTDKDDKKDLNEQYHNHTHANPKEVDDHTTTKSTTDTLKPPSCSTTSIRNTQKTTASAKKTTKTTTMNSPSGTKSTTTRIARESSFGSHTSNKSNSSDSSSTNKSSNGKRSPVQAIASAVRAIESPYLLHNKNNVNMINEDKENMSETSNSQNTNSQKSQTKLFSNRSLTSSSWRLHHDAQQQQQQQQQHEEKEEDHPEYPDDILSSSPPVNDDPTTGTTAEKERKDRETSENRTKMPSEFVTATQALSKDKSSSSNAYNSNDSQSGNETNDNSSSWYHNNSDDDDDDDNDDDAVAGTLSKSGPDYIEEVENKEGIKDGECALQRQEDESNITSPSNTQVNAAEALAGLASGGDNQTTELIPVESTNNGEPTSTTATSTTTHNYEYSY